MNLDWYYTFIVVAKHLNYRKASEDLFISQTAVFNQIKNLEKELEMNLFENHKNNISLTKAGCEFLLIAQEIIELNEKKIIKLKEVQNAPKMMVNLLVSSYIAIYIIPKFLLEAFEHFPNIDINVKVLKDNQEISSKSTDLLILRDSIP
ncbi:LysR family transcriptional regulator, partial [Lactococcus garvieae]|uniref:LysR family transcriptional regulator n=1 Tax=Lactococcus garvieae TaxID=1363 RepID=UPI00254FB260